MTKNVSEDPYKWPQQPMWLWWSWSFRIYYGAEHFLLAAAFALRGDEINSEEEASATQEAYYGGTSRLKQAVAA